MQQATFLHNMYKRTCCNLLKIPQSRIRHWITTFDAVLFDADGVLWWFKDPIAGSANVFNALKAMGKKVFICTNNSAYPRTMLAKKANDMGIYITPNEIITSSRVVANFLAQRNFEKTVYIIGQEAIALELDEVNIKHTPIGPDIVTKRLAEVAETLQLDENIGAVVVGEDMHFSMAKLLKASSYLLNQECLFLGTNRDIGLIRDNKLIPNAGPLIAAVKTCCRRRPYTLGKPNPIFCAELINCGIIEPERTLMVGDTLHTDIVLGNNCGFQTLFVGSGFNSLDDVRRAQCSEGGKFDKLVPDVYLPKLHDLMQFLPIKDYK